MREESHNKTEKSGTKINTGGFSSRGLEKSD